MGKPPYSLVACLSPPESQSFLKASYYLVYSSFWNLIPFFLSARPVSALNGLLYIKSCIFLSSFRMDLTNPSRALGRPLLLSAFRKLLTLSGIPFFFTNLFRVASLLSLLIEFNLSFLIGVLAWFIKITKAALFESVEVFRKNSFLAVYFSLFSSTISLSSSVSCSLYADDLAIWSFSPSVPTPLEATQGALFCLEGRSEYWCFPLNPSKCEVFFFSVDLHQANLQPPFQSHSNLSWGHLQLHSFIL